MRFFSVTILSCEWFSQKVVLKKDGIFMKKFFLKREQSSQLQNESGSALLVSVLVLSMLALSGVGVVKMSAASQINSSLDLSNQKASYLAQAGLSIASHRLYHGDDPAMKENQMLDGVLEINVDPMQRTISGKGQYGEAIKTLSYQGRFAADCFGIDFKSSKYVGKIGVQEWSRLEDIEIKKNCADIGTVKVKEMRILFDDPNFTKLVKHVDIDKADSLYHVPSWVVPDYPQIDAVGTPEDGAQSQQVIDVENYALTGDSLKNLYIWWNVTFTKETPIRIEVVFVDGSVYTSPVQNLVEKPQQPNFLAQQSDPLSK